MKFIGLNLNVPMEPPVVTECDYVCIVCNRMAIVKTSCYNLSVSI